jgi:hypothetical protein
VTRVYVPLSVDALAAFFAAGSIGGSADRFVAEDETEEAEYDALAAAAEEAVGLLDGPGRRAVVVAEVADVDAGFGFDRVVAVHADTDQVDPAARVLPELGWFATQEIEDLLGSG